jgi:hypothetical protein
MVYYETSDAIAAVTDELNSALTSFDSYIRNNPQRDEEAILPFRKRIKLLRLRLDELRELEIHNRSTERMTLKTPSTMERTLWAPPAKGTLDSKSAVGRAKPAAAR